MPISDAYRAGNVLSGTRSSDLLEIIDFSFPNASFTSLIPNVAGTFKRTSDNSSPFGLGSSTIFGIATPVVISNVSEACAIFALLHFRQHEVLLGVVTRGWDDFLPKLQVDEALEQFGPTTLSVFWLAFLLSHPAVSSLHQTPLWQQSEIEDSQISPPRV